jgi:hypothetical protein
MPYTLTRATSAASKLYNREPSSTIDPPTKMAKTPTYTQKQQQQQKQDAALKTLRLHVF